MQRLSPGVNLGNIPPYIIFLALFKDGVFPHFRGEASEIIQILLITKK